MKPPLVSRKLLAARRPVGTMVNSLPEVYLAVRPDGAWWVMEDKTEQVCLAVIPAETVNQLRASREVRRLEITL